MASNRIPPILIPFPHYSSSSSSCLFFCIPYCLLHTSLSYTQFARSRFFNSRSFFSFVHCPLQSFLCRPLCSLPQRPVLPLLLHHFFLLFPLIFVFVFVSSVLLLLL